MRITGADAHIVYVKAKYKTQMVSEAQFFCYGMDRLRGLRKPASGPMASASHWGCMMFKPVHELVKPDPRYVGAVYRDNITGEIRAATIEDFHTMVVGLELTEAVPPPIREQFDKARNAFVYSWFCYDMATLAEQQAYAVVEMAVREKLRLVGGAPPRNLKRLLTEADKRGWLGDDGKFLINALPYMRNELAHGSSHLNPANSLEMLGYCREVLNGLFPA